MARTGYGKKLGYSFNNGNDNGLNGIHAEIGQLDEKNSKEQIYCVDRY
jgi:hypothetical protein